MGAAMGFRGAKHNAAWEWLNSQDADVALVQEAVPLTDFTEHWGSVIFKGKWDKTWGCGVLVRDGRYEAWEPTSAHPWIQRVGGAAVLARPMTGVGPWLGSVHSDASSFEATHRRYPTLYGDLPARDGVLRCSAKEMWEIEVIAHELSPLLLSHNFILGGDLNSSLLFDKQPGGQEAQLFANLAALGFVDLRPRHAIEEVQTFFRAGTRPFQLDHVFADEATERAVASWEVLTEVATELRLSDHAPVVIETLDPA